MKNWPAVVETPAPPPPEHRQRGGSIIFNAAAGSLALLALALFSGSHIVFAIIAIPIVILMAWTNPEAMIAMLPIWMVLMGLIRRITPGGGNVTFSGDPVLIIGPIALLVLVAVVVSRRDAGTMSRLARCVMAFNVIAFVEAFNPKQGSLLTGLGGLLFVLVPTAAFWVGRKFADPDFFVRIIWTVAVMGLVSAIYGLIQQFVRFPSWDQQWIQSKGYTALNVGGNVVRAFSFFSSAEEYAVFLSVAVVAWVALLARKTRWPFPLHVAATVTVLIALFYESQRTSFFLVFLALGVMAASRLKMRPVMVMGAGAGMVVLVIVFAGALGGGGGGGGVLANPQSTASILAGHQGSGLSNPLGGSSSLKGHIHETYLGLKEGVHDPLGHGTGSVTEAASRYTTQNKNHGTEFDLGNMGIAFGLPGVVVYLFLVFFAFQMAYRLAVRRRDPTGLFIIGIAATTLMQWTNGDLYSVCWLIWLSLGVGEYLISHPDTDPDPATDQDRVPSLAPPPAWRRPGERRRPAGSW